MGSSGLVSVWELTTQVFVLRPYSPELPRVPLFKRYRRGDDPRFLDVETFLRDLLGWGRGTGLGCGASISTISCLGVLVTPMGRLVDDIRVPRT